jgi:4-carboxymuconolactone decarboxylase
MTRMPDLDPAAMNPAQRQVYEAVVAGPRGRLAGPIQSWLRSPDMAMLAQGLGAAVRFKNSLPDRLKELAILTTGRYWHAQFEWYAHARIAREVGLQEDYIQALEAERRPDFGTDDEAAAVYDFADALIRKHRVPESAYDAVLAKFGEQGAVDLVVTCGYYSLVAMTLNAFEVPLPEGVTGLPEPDL